MERRGPYSAREHHEDLLVGETVTPAGAGFTYKVEKTAGKPFPDLREHHSTISIVVNLLLQGTLKLEPLI